ncbi:MAG: beta-ketoacyl-ACP synthase II [Candidatus Omnitrophica bacterium]|nr:beta-ketoacyl-ACP synthase II [Candidatus Omnitrophota bacterium]
MKKRRVVVTGMGVLASNGNGIAAFKEAIFSGVSGIGPITRFDASNLDVKIAAEVKGFDPVEHMPVAVARKTDRFAQFGVTTARMAIDDAGLSENDSALTKAAVIIGSGLGGMNFHEEAMFALIETSNPKKVPASSVPRITPNAVSAYIALQNKIKGPNQVISTACSSSGQAIGEAFRKVRSGEIDTAVTGGVEATISIVNMAMYQAMMVLGSPLGEDLKTASRPFDKTRNGFVMGEGAACLILEELEHARNRGAKIYAEVVGFGSTCGAYHMVAPNPSGEDAAETMRLALHDAGLNQDSVDYISAHGTSTKLNDLAETQAIKSLFGQYAKDIPVSSIKSMIGHTIGASGAIQAVACCLAIDSSCIPPTINLNSVDEECDLDYVPNQSREKELSVVLSNSFGFGSNNAVLAFAKIR